MVNYFFLFLYATCTCQLLAWFLIDFHPLISALRSCMLMMAAHLGSMLVSPRTYLVIKFPVLSPLHFFLVVFAFPFVLFLSSISPPKSPGCSCNRSSFLPFHSYAFVLYADLRLPLPLSVPFPTSFFCRFSRNWPCKGLFWSWCPCISSSLRHAHCCLVFGMSFRRLLVFHAQVFHFECAFYTVMVLLPELTHNYDLPRQWYHSKLLLFWSGCFSCFSLIS